MTAPSARCRVWVQAERRVRTCSPPTTTWIAIQAGRSEGEPDERRARPLRSRHATTATADHDRPDDGRHPAMEDVGRGRPRSVPAMSEPPISGQSGKTSAESVAVTCEPNSSRAKVASAANAASSVNRWLPPRPTEPGRVAGPDGHEDEQGDEQHRGREMGRDRLPAVAEADGLATEPGLEADEPDGRDRRPQERPAGRDGRGRPATARPRISNPMIAATVRWIHSIQALGSSSGGISWPWQSGQSGQPRPESVARTMTPMVTSTMAVPSVSAASFWKRVNDLLGHPRRARSGWSASGGRTVRHSSAAGRDQSPTRRADVDADDLGRARRADGLRYALPRCCPFAAPPIPRRRWCWPSSSAPARMRPPVAERQSERRRGLPDDPAPAGTPDGWDVAPSDPRLPPDHQPGRHPGLRSDPADVLVPRRRQRAGRHAGPRGRGRAVRPRRRPGEPGRHGAGHVHLGDRADGRGVRRGRRLPDGRAVGRRAADDGRGRQPETIRIQFDVQRRVERRRGRRSGTGVGHADPRRRRRRRRRRSRPTSDPVDGVLQTSVKRRAGRRRSRSCSRSRRRSSAPRPSADRPSTDSSPSRQPTRT